MKIVLTTVKPDIQSEVDPRFGRSAYLLFIDFDTGDWEAIPNPGREASGGAGIQVAQLVSQKNIAAAVSGEFGPNAFNALGAAGIVMYRYGDVQNASEAIARFKTGELEKVEAASGRPNKGYRGER